MVTINNTHYKTIKEAVAATGLKPAQLKRRYFTTGRGIVDGFDIVFDDAQAVDINQWITDNYVTLYETTKKYYEYDDDLFQDCIISLINNVGKGKVKNYEQAFYNRYRGAVLDAKRKKANIKKKQSDSHEDEYYINSGGNIEQSHIIKTSCSDEFDLFDYAAASVYDDSSYELDTYERNELMQLDCIRAVLIKYNLVSDVDLYMEAMRKSNHDKHENTIYKLGKTLGLKRHEVSAINTRIESQLQSDDIIDEIRECYMSQKQNTFDDLTLKDILS